MHNAHKMAGDFSEHQALVCLAGFFNFQDA